MGPEGIAGFFSFEELKDELAARDEAQSLDELIDFAIGLANRLRETSQRFCVSLSAPLFPPDPARPLDSDQPASEVSPVSLGTEEPMQLGRSKLTTQERRRRVTRRLCIYCGEGGHFLAHCLELLKGRAHQVNWRLLVSQPSSTSGSSD